MQWRIQDFPDGGGGRGVWCGGVNLLFGKKFAEHENPLGSANAMLILIFGLSNVNFHNILKGLLQKRLINST